jgi:endo-1,4-beta-D-glucanase Y
VSGSRSVPSAASAAVRLLVSVLFAVVLAACGLVPSPAPPPSPLATEIPVPSPTQAAEDFLDAYVGPEGRVVRHDQGGDTVSEGQAYALLLAQVAERPEVFERVWAWTRRHLQRGDKLFAWRWLPDGTGDDNPAADADLLIAWALLRAEGRDAQRYRAEGRQVAAAVLSREVAETTDGLLLAAGPWAIGEDGVVVNPSYWTPAAYRALARATGDPRWEQLAAAVVPAVSLLTAAGARLPADWARLEADGRLSPAPAPGGGTASALYGLDAQRVVVWLATDCDREGRRLAAQWYPALSTGPTRAAAMTLTLDGDVLAESAHPLPLVASAAAADAAGDAAARDRFLRRASAQQQRHPTYYGAAWLALGTATLGSATGLGCAG